MRSVSPPRWHLARRYPERGRKTRAGMDWRSCSRAGKWARRPSSVPCGPADLPISTESTAVHGCAPLNSREHMTKALQEISRWDTFEAAFKGPSTGNPFSDVDLFVVFSHGNRELRMTGFYDGEGTYRARFM